MNDAGFLDEKGVIRVSLNAPHFEGAYFLYRDYFKKLKTIQPAAVLFEFITVESDERRQEAILAALPIYSSSGVFRSAVYFNLLTDELIKDFTPPDSIGRGFWMIDSRGNFLHTPRIEGITPAAPAPPPPPSFKTFLEGVKTGILYKGEYLSFNGVRTIAASYPIKPGNFNTWHVIISTPESIISTLLKISSVRFTIATIIAMLVVASTSFLIIFVINRWTLELDSIIKDRTKELENYAGQLEEARNNSERKVEERTRELKRAHEALVRKEKLAVLGELAASVSHELRNPLGVIKNAIYFFKMRIHTFDDREIRENIQLIDNEISTANKIISDMLDFTRDKPPIRLAVDLNQLASEMLSKITIPDAVKLETDFSHAITPVSADPTQLAQVFTNIIENALHSMEKGGTLRVSTKEIDGTVTVTFDDDGSGISPDNLEKIFEPLFTTKTKGIGLGLAISKSLIEANGGTITAESDGKHGSTFTIQFNPNR